MTLFCGKSRLDSQKAPVTITAAVNKSSKATANSEKPITLVKDEKKPEGAAKKAKDGVTVRADWIYFFDEVKRLAL